MLPAPAGDLLHVHYVNIPKSVLPVHAGVFPSVSSIMAAFARLPRMRGGVSVGKRVLGKIRFLPCICGGISRKVNTGCQDNASSPPTRGCFPGTRCSQPHPEPFPANAGVLPTRPRGIGILA